MIGSSPYLAPMPQANTIDDVMLHLDAIIEAARKEDHPSGYFAYVYRRTTAAVKAAIEAGRFNDNARMEAFDVAFANLYLDAHEKYCCGSDCSASWRLAFDGAKEQKSLLQHVLLGMNAHINLDLGVAAGRLMAGKNLDELKPDFLLVNDILQEIIDELQDRIARASPVFYWLDRLGSDRDERLLDVSMRAAREKAWMVARMVWSAGEDHARVITRIDRNVARFGERINRPGTRVTRWLWRGMALLDRRGIGGNIDRLSWQVGVLGVLGRWAVGVLGLPQGGARWRSFGCAGLAGWYVGSLGYRKALPAGARSRRPEGLARGFIRFFLSSFIPFLLYSLRLVHHPPVRNIVF